MAPGITIENHQEYWKLTENGPYTAILDTFATTNRNCKRCKNSFDVYHIPNFFWKNIRYCSEQCIRAHHKERVAKYQELCSHNGKKYTKTMVTAKCKQCGESHSVPWRRVLSGVYMCENCRNIVVEINKTATKTNSGTSGKRCITCGDALIGKQRKYCSQKCNTNNYYYRTNRHERDIIRYNTDAEYRGRMKNSAAKCYSNRKIRQALEISSGVN